MRITDPEEPFFNRGDIVKITRTENHVCNRVCVWGKAEGKAYENKAWCINFSNWENTDYTQAHAPFNYKWLNELQKSVPSHYFDIKGKMGEYTDLFVRRTKYLNSIKAGFKAR